MAEGSSGSRFTATVSIIVALLGLVAAIITLVAKLGDVPSPRKLEPSNGPSVEVPVPRPNIFKSEAPALAPSQESKPSANGSCYLPGNWELVLPSSNTEPMALPVRFSDNSFIVTYGKEIRTSCVIKSDSIEVAPPPFNLGGDDEAVGFSMAMPTHYDRQSENSYVGTALLGKCYLRRK